MFPTKTVHEKRWENVPRSPLFCCYNRWLGAVAPEEHVGPRKWNPLSLSHLSQEGVVYGDRKTPTAGNLPNQKPVPPAAWGGSRVSPGPQASQSSLPAQVSFPIQSANTPGRCAYKALGFTWRQAEWKHPTPDGAITQVSMLSLSNKGRQTTGVKMKFKNP